MIKFLLVLCFSALTLSEKCPPEEEPEIRRLRETDRLSNGILPISYNITLEPNFETEKFSGSVEIQIKFANNTEYIELHAYKLDKIVKESVNIDCDDLTLNVLEVANPNDTSQLSIVLDRQVPIDTICLLQINGFEGNLSYTDRSGLYLAKYVEEGTDKVFATTQFEKTGARKTFPCFDEPDFRATMGVQLIRKKNYISISNEELEYTIDLDSERVMDIYKETKSMPTYLLAFIVTEYGSTERILEQRVFADKPAIQNGDADFALKMGMQVLSALEVFTETRYGFSKIDQIGIPDSYFDPGAMENWGLVTYRKSLLVYPFKQQVTKGFQKTVSIIAHEFSHQWFGNLVTCKWWNYLWLNEGFADYFEYFASAMVGWDLKDIYIMDSVQGALRQDSVNTTTSMNSENAPNFIVYQKAGSVIRMMSHIVTQDVFQKSIALYLKNNQYQSVTPVDLYQAFHTVIEQEDKTSLLGTRTISEIMTSWDSQAGYPILHVTKNNTAIDVRQERFFTDGSIDNTTTWIIPLTYVLGDRPTHNFSTTTTNIWMESDRLVIDEQSDGWVIFNKQQTGYYRVKYDQDNWNRLISQLNENDHTQIHSLNRAQLIDDGFTFAQIQTMVYSDVLELSKYLIKEQHYVPMAVFLKHVSVISDKLAQANGRENYTYFMDRVFTMSILDTVQMKELETDTLDTVYLRIELIKWLCRVGNQQCTNYALQTFTSDSAITPDLQEPIYCGAMRTANENSWNSLFAKLTNETNDLSRSRIINGLGCSENSNILSSYIEKILDENNTLSVLAGFRSVLNSGDIGVQFLLNYISTNFETFKLLNDAKTIITDLAAKLNTQDHKNILDNLAQANPDAESLFDDAKIRVDANIEWNSQHGGNLKNWFAQYRSSTTQNSGFILKINLSLLISIVITTILKNCFR